MVGRIFKCGAIRLIHQEFQELEEFLWGGGLWAGGYFAGAAGQVDVNN